MQAGDDRSLGTDPSESGDLISWLHFPRITEFHDLTQHMQLAEYCGAHLTYPTAWNDAEHTQNIWPSVVVHLCITAWQSCPDILRSCSFNEDECYDKGSTFWLYLFLGDWVTGPLNPKAVGILFYFIFAT